MRIDDVEPVVGLLLQDPRVGARLLVDVLGAALPDCAGRHQVSPYAGGVHVAQGDDRLLLGCPDHDRLLLAVRLLVQREWDPRAPRRWALLTARLRLSHRSRAGVLVFCPDPEIARRYRRLLAAASSPRSRPLVFSRDDVPLVVNVDQARLDPQWAVFAMACNAEDSDADRLVAAFPALAAALWVLEPEDTERRVLALRKAEEVLRTLERREVAVPAPARDRIAECGDLEQLDVWLLRAATARSIDDVLTVDRR